MTIYKLELRNQLRSTLIWALVLSGFVLMYLCFFPSMKTDAMQALVNVKLDAIPPSLLAILGMERLPDFTQITNYFCFIFQYMSIAIAVFAGLVGAGALIREESDGTIEYLFAQPVTRSKIVWQKLLAVVTLIFILTLIVAGVSLACHLAFGGDQLTVPEMLENMGYIFSGVFMQALTFGLMGFFVSALVKHYKQALPVTMGLVFGTFVLGALASIVTQLEFLKYLSPFEVFKPSQLVSTGFEPIGTAVCIGSILVFAALTFMIYNKKDLLS